MYNYGLTKFLQAKNLKSNQAINAFLKSEGCDFTAKNHNRVNNYLQSNWNKWATFVDKGLKDGTLSGTSKKLNHYFDEEKERRERVNKEFKEIDLTPEQMKVFDFMKEHGVGKIQSILMKSGFSAPGKNYEYESRKLQWLPLVNKVIESEIDLNIIDEDF